MNLLIGSLVRFSDIDMVVDFTVPALQVPVREIVDRCFFASRKPFAV
ncbi:conserved protein of unknown function [Limnospira indica PCC 8005]|uniref:Uncharacterized protein n=1 Tax=Limnospira indica PCC 8005 TaxID=376219 RepID=A0A9P1NZJ1_9CYAN|nr:conserved protein of unknown function [Limnospira indica PCC 8005]CDM95930.1 conserved protein of unknown function [Limnospira indica PCC 8005]